MYNDTKIVVNKIRALLQYIEKKLGFKSGWWKYKFAELNSIKEELKIAQNAEKDRLQYVGMTRARCELYIPIIVK